MSKFHIINKITNAISEIREDENIRRVTSDDHIVICEKCCGLGKKRESKLVNYHHNEYDYWYEKCRFCNGHGRVNTKTIKIIYPLTEEDLAI